MKEEIESIKKYATINNVPIMQDSGINYLTNYIKKHTIMLRRNDFYVIN